MKDYYEVHYDDAKIDGLGIKYHSLSEARKEAKKIFDKYSDLYVRGDSPITIDHLVEQDGEYLLTHYWNVLKKKPFELTKMVAFLP